MLCYKYHFDNKIKFQIIRNRDNNPFSLLITLDDNREARGDLYWDDGLEKVEKGFSFTFLLDLTK